MKIQMPAPDIDLLQLPSLMLPAVSLAAIVGEPDTLRLSVNLTRPTSLPDGGYQLTRTQVVGMVDWLVRWLAGEMEIDAIMIRTQARSET